MLPNFLSVSVEEEEAYEVSSLRVQSLDNKTQKDAQVQPLSKSSTPFKLTEYLNEHMKKGRG